jgi:hypothetical protein
MTTSISPAATDRMTAWYSRRPSFALMGEYSSGKSALLNVLLGQRLLPTKVTATDLPAIWITQGKQARLQALAYDGTLHDLMIDDLTSEAAMDYLVIRIESDAEILRRVDIIDTPGISDPRMSTAIVEQISRFCDFVMWCSPANQAWRQTERAFWKTMPDRLRQHSILALTRADKMRSTQDLDKVLRRCGSEAGGEFAAILAMSTPLAMAAREATNPRDAGEKWVASGAEQLLHQVDRAVDAAVVACAARPDLPDPVSIIKPTQKKAEKPARKQPRSELQSALPAEIAATIFGLKNDAFDSSNNERTMATISHLFVKVNKDNSLTEEHRNVLSRSLTVRTTFNPNVPRMVGQVEHEVADFAEGAWCELGR